MLTGRDAGGHSWPNDTTPFDPMPLVDQLERQGEIDPDEATVYLQRLLLACPVDDARSQAIRHVFTLATDRVNADSLTAALCVLTALPNTNCTEDPAMTHDHDHLHDCDGDGNMAFTRRAFLQRNFALAAAPTVPWFVQQGDGLSRPAGLSSIPGVAEEPRFGGGATGRRQRRVEHGHSLLRPAVLRPPAHARVPGPGIQPKRHRLERRRVATGPQNGSGPAPRLAPLKELHDDGEVATIPGCGYPNPNRSHFASMDIWYTVTAIRREATAGWAGISTHPVAEGSNEAAIAIGNNAPSLTDQACPNAFRAAQQFSWTGADIHESLGETYQAMSGEAASTLSLATANPTGFLGAPTWTRRLPPI